MGTGNGVPDTAKAMEPHMISALTLALTPDELDLDLVARLRAGICDDRCKAMEARSGCSCAEAADEIERLRARLDEYELRDVTR